jgi:hypothetical protein
VIKYRKGDLTEGAGAPSEILITEAMVRAGMYAAREHCLGAGLEDLVKQVYLAMDLERLG